MKQVVVRLVPVTVWLVSIGTASCSVTAPQTTSELNGIESIKTASYHKTRCEQLDYSAAQAVRNGMGSKEVEAISKLANQGDTYAMSFLAFIFRPGAIPPADWSKVRMWSEKGAALNDPCCLISLSELYAAGEAGLPKDPSKAWDLLKQAEKFDPPDAKLCLAMTLYDEKIKTKKEQKMVVDLLSEAAVDGSATATFDLGRLYELGASGIKVDTQKADELYLVAAQFGNEEAMLCLGLNYEFGKGVPKDHKRALGWFKKLADLGNSEGKRYYSGLMKGYTLKQPSN